MPRCPVISVGGGHWTICTLPAGHPRSHKDRQPWQPVTPKEAPTMPYSKHHLAPEPEVLRDGSLIVPDRREALTDHLYDRLPLPVPNRQQPPAADESTPERAATRCLRAAQELKAADAAVDQAEANLRQALDRQQAAASAAHAAALDLVRATSAKADRA